MTRVAERREQRPAVRLRQRLAARDTDVAGPVAADFIEDRRRASRCSPPLKAYSVSQYPQRSGQPVRRTNTVGWPTVLDSPWMEWKISVMRS